MLGHGNLDFVIRGIAQGRALKPGDRAYAALPITHAFGLTSVLLAMLSAGGSVRLVERFDAQRAVASFEHEPVSHFNGVPTMFSTICDNLDQRGTPFSAPTLRFIGSGGAPLGKSLIERVRRCMHLPLHSGYGMSEAGPTITMTDIGAPPEDENLGYPLPGTSLSVRDAEGRELPPGAVGELYVHSPGISPGYFRAPAQTLEVFKSGWLRTGDLGRVDDKGQLYLAGRSKDLIIRSGFNVYPLELETIVAAHPHVAECAVLGFPSGGDADAVAKSLAEMVAPYKRPTRVIAVDKFETTLAGKVVKSTLLPLLAPAPALAG
jgi:acyl-CoA synthetase (AMP-forming)/AMP-acid ligase II